MSSDAASPAVMGSADRVAPAPSHAPASPADRDLSRIDILDVWRGVACLMVFAWHTGVAARNPPVAFFGCTGVHLFFVLSGYLLYRPFADAMFREGELPSVRTFYVRRLLRIYPPYLVALLAFVTLRHLTGTQPPDALNIATHALLIFNFFPSQNFFSINPVFWSLAIEVQFYLLLPLGCRAAVRLARTLRRPDSSAALLVPATFIATGLAVRTFETGFAYPHGTHFQSVFAFLDMFGVGMWIVFRRAAGMSPRRAGSIAWQLTIGLLLFLAANNWIAVEGDWLTGGSRAYAIVFPLVVCLGAALVLEVAIALPSRVSGSAAAAPLRFVGMVSYSLYLYHVGVQFVIFRLVPLDGLSYSSKSILYSLIAIGPAVLAAWIMYRLVEKPAMRLAARVRKIGRPDRDAVLDRAPLGIPAGRPPICNARFSIATFQEQA